VTASWTNWSGRIRSEPLRLETPTSEDELRRLVRDAAQAHQVIRTAGSGHSFVPLCSSKGLLLSLDGLRGVIDVDEDSRSAWIWAGSKLWELGETLRDAGLAMETLSDIDRQSLAGAVSTGTHGTGRHLRSLSNQITGLRLVTAPEGAVLELGADDPQTLRAAQVSLGALGVLTRVRLRLLPTYRLHERTWFVGAEECLEQLEELIAEHRHFEFFWTSKRDSCFMKTLDPTEEDPDEMPQVKGERIGHSDVILPSERNEKFNEIEFAIPAADGVACFREIRELMLRRYPQVEWPLEYRTLAADELPLSPAYGRPTVTISAHEAAELDCEGFFAEIESIFRTFDGRPHWGKVHTHDAAQLAPKYPLWQEFQEVRRRLDPDGSFSNSYLRQLLGRSLR
jgi:FAD/FMN-containing dehydrogenase